MFKLAMSAAACAAVAGLSCVASPSWSQVAVVAPATDFSRCDGYGVATAGGDGMTRYATSLGIFKLPESGNTMLGKASTSAEGVRACGSAIAQLPPGLWMRQVNLLRARAFHYLELRQPAEALADLDSADAVAKGKTDLFYDRSLGLSIRFVRAYALRQLGDAAKADALARETAASRPFLRQGALLVYIAKGPGADMAQLDELARDNTRLNPVGLDFQFQRTLGEGRLTDALSLYPQLLPPTSYGVATDAQSEQFRALAIIYKESRALEYAYLLAALGRNADARAALAQAKADFAKAIESPPEPVGVDEPITDRTKRMATINMNLQINSAGREGFEIWGRLVDLRVKVSEGQVADVLASLAAKPLPVTWQSLELDEAIDKAAPGQGRPSTAATEATRARLIHTDDQDKNLASMWKDLPEPETADRLPLYRPGNAPLLAFNEAAKNNIRAQGEGYRSLPAALPGATAVRYRILRGTAAMAEDLVLIRAAELAKQAGKSGFIILARHDVHFSTTLYQYSRPVRTDPNGFETEIDVVFADPQSPPAPYDATPWRVVDANGVLAALAPIYGSSTSPKTQ